MIHLHNKTELAQLETVADWVRFAASRFNEAGLFYGHGTMTAADEARALVWHVLHLDFDAPDYFYGARITTAERQRLSVLIHRRSNERIPLPYLTGEAWFCGLAFEVNPSVLIPRSPIAELIEAGYAPWLTNKDSVRVLDMCTGSGCIAIATAVTLTHALVDAVDNDAAALAVAQRNVTRHDVDGRVTLHQSDLFNALARTRYDLIVCNPPYVSDASMASLPAEYAHEPAHALRADAHGLELVDRFLNSASEYLAADGHVIVEVGESAARFAQAYPNLAVTWCEFEHGGEGVFVISAAALKTFTSMHDKSTVNGR